MREGDGVELGKEPSVRGATGTKRGFGKMPENGRGGFVDADPNSFPARN